ncbi:MAG: hypothetical protein AMXMBFR13_41890 [Phycisphaerae bacterium]
MASVPPGRSIRWNDAREVAGLIGSLAAGPRGVPVQYDHFLEQSLQLLHARVGVLMHTTLDRQQPLHLHVLGSAGWLTGEQRALFREDAANHRYRANPFLGQLEQALIRAPTARSVVRRELVDHRRWYRCEYVNQTFRLLDIDDLLISAARRRLDGSWTWLAYLRPWGDRRPFSPREQSMALLLACGVSAVLPAQPQAPTLARSADSTPDGLPRRLREVWHLLLEGLSEKQVAGVLKLSPATVHRHVTRLYRLLGISSRSELFTRELRAQADKLHPLKHRIL